MFSNSSNSLEFINFSIASGESGVSFTFLGGFGFALGFALGFCAGLVLVVVSGMVGSLSLSVGSST